jgi:hypothetical protein
MAPNLIAVQYCECGQALGHPWECVFTLGRQLQDARSEIEKLKAVPDLLKVYMQPAVVAIAEKIEGDLLNSYAGFAANAAITPLESGKTMTDTRCQKTVDATRGFHCRFVPDLDNPEYCLCGWHRAAHRMEGA